MKVENKEESRELRIMSRKKCAYCGKDTKGTKEHIISNGILDLFPECFLTIDETKKIVHEADPVIKDVCADCNNNKISYIDSYAKEMVEKYFLKKYDKDSKVEFEYDYALMQKVLLKYAYNDLRVHKKNIDFYDKSILSYLISEEDNVPKRNVIVLGGLAVNTSPVPDFLFGNQKLQWLRNPVLFANSIVMNLNYDTGEIMIRDPFEIEKFDDLKFSYIFRFNSGQFIILCFDNDILDERLEQIKIVLGVQYPYVVLDEENKKILSRCTSEMTYHRIGLVDVSWGQGLFDEISIMRELAAPESKNYYEKMTKKWEIYEKELAKEHKR